MKKICKISNKEFEVSEQEQQFLEKIGLPVPNTHPDIRMQGRFAFRNERKLYHRKCDLTGKQIISIYRPDSEYTVYDQHEWRSDKWDALDYGKEFDFNRSFFEQMDELMKVVPKISVFTSRNENSDFTNGTQQDKNCYMIFVSDHDEDCFYSYSIFDCKDCLDCLNCFKCQLCLECVDCFGSYNLTYCDKTHNCSDSKFLYDCKACKNCFMCFGLRGKQYCIKNIQYSKEEYQQKMKEIDLGSRSLLNKIKNEFRKLVSQKQIHQYYDGNQNQNITGDHIIGSKNSLNCYDGANLEDCGNLIFGFNSKDCYDGHVVVDKCELCFETISTVNQYNAQFTFCSWYSNNSMYIDHCISCDECFACSGLNKKKYCILNKQYSKEEYFELKEKIIEHMILNHSLHSGLGKEWGMNFPVSLSPFGYNETVAQEYFPLTKEEVLSRGWKWTEESEMDAVYQGPKTELPDHIKDVEDDITDKILICEASGKPYKLIHQELERYRNHNLALPRKCFDERHMDRIKRRNPRTLWERSCMKCEKELMTTYSPDRTEIIYCEECYRVEVN